MPAFEEMMKARIEKELRFVTAEIEAFKCSPGESSERVEWLACLLERAAGLDEALYRLKHGTFGRCVVCETPLRRERLEAAPEESLCSECQERLERARPGRDCELDWASAAQTVR